MEIPGFIVLERRGGRLAVAPAALDQELDALLCTIEHLMGAPGKGHTFLVDPQRLLETELTGLELGDHRPQTLQHAIETQGLDRLGPCVRLRLGPAFDAALTCLSGLVH
jgi:hypothetical protein